MQCYYPVILQQYTGVMHFCNISGLLHWQLLCIYVNIDMWDLQYNTSSDWLSREVLIGRDTTCCFTITLWGEDGLLKANYVFLLLARIQPTSCNAMIKHAKHCFTNASYNNVILYNYNEIIMYFNNLHTITSH